MNPFIPVNKPHWTLQYVSTKIDLTICFNCETTAKRCILISDILVVTFCYLKYRSLSC